MKHLLLILFSLVFLAGCGGEEKDDDPKPIDPKAQAKSLLLGKWFITEQQTRFYEPGATTPSSNSSFTATFPNKEGNFDYSDLKIRQAFLGSYNNGSSNNSFITIYYDYEMVDATHYKLFRTSDITHTVLIKELTPNKLRILWEQPRNDGGKVEYEIIFSK